VTRKITRAAASIKLGLQDKLFLGNIDSIRDWGYAPEYVEAMWLMLQADEPDDFVVATGVSATVKDFLEASFESLDLDWTKFVEIDPIYLRPTEVDALVGDPSKITRATNWTPETTAIALAGKMTLADMNICSNPSYLDEFNWRF
jgi:GDPmannose 4,6-dehydratase